MSPFEKHIILLFLLLFSQLSFAQSSVNFTGKKMIFGDQVEVLIDKKGDLRLEKVIESSEFQQSTTEVLNMQVTPYAYWIRFKVTNHTDFKDIRFQINYPLIDSLQFYQFHGDSLIYKNFTGANLPFATRQIPEHQFFIYPLAFSDSGDVTCYLRVRSGTQLMLPMYIGTRDQLLGVLLSKDLLFGIYFGIILVMILYNGFIYLSLRDEHYLLYIIYLLSVGYTQASLEGYTFRFLLPNDPNLANFNIYISSSLIGITAIEFAKKFLDSKAYVPVLHKISYVFLGVYSLAIVLPFFGMFNLSYQIILMSAAFSGVYVLIMAWEIMRKGSRPANYFLIAWTVFILGVLVFVLKDFGILPYNTFTSSALQIGSAFEAVMLSFALADRINLYREQKQAYQQEAFDAVQENERIVREQNSMLEREVNLRTIELQQANAELEQLLNDLKEAETQLVESEKMASLGQLTAGIAHEINNPINFVTSNISPLNRDILILENILADMERIASSDFSQEEKVKQIETLKTDADYDYLKVEIEMLLTGIKEGAERTSEIVKGLRLFSRLDEDDIKYADLNEGLDSTISIINHLLNGQILLNKDYGQLPLIECYPGKLNQVFLNIITNGIHAIQARWGHQSGGQLTIQTRADAINVYIRIKDNGVGMSEEVQKKLFEPFFTTKDVGAGTGLGMSIVWTTIHKHQGTIEVISELNLGTEFVLTIPIYLANSTNNLIVN